MKNPDLSLSRSRRLGLMTTQIFRPAMRFRFWFVPVLALALLAGGIFVQRRLESTVRKQMADGLEMIVNINEEALRIWLQDQSSFVQILGEAPRVGEFIRQILRETGPGDATGEELLASKALAEMRELMEPVLRERTYDGFVITAKNGINIASTWDQPLGSRELFLKQEVVRRAMEGEVVISPPYPSVYPWPRSDGSVSAGAPTMLAAAPVRDEAGEVVAVLSVRIHPRGDFIRLLQISRMESSAETYAFNADGLLVSQSRFDDELRHYGLIPEEEGSEGFLTLELRDPGGNLQEGYRPTAERGGQPLTRAVAAAVSGKAGYDVVGYRDYRGVTVVGAWRWLPEYGFGIVVQQDYAEAFAMPNRLRGFVWSLFAVVVLAGAALLLTTMLISRLSRKMSQTVSEVRRLGQYSLEKKIGEGGMGAVYRATHALLRRPTAIKLLHPERAGPEEIARFEREVQVTSRLTHPNTIAVYDYGRDAEGVFYYAMEYLPGIDLKKLVEVDGAQPPGRVIHILRQICGSLSEAHDIGLIHRDIKPGNIILCERGGVQDVAKVLDFGIVKSLSPGDTQLTAVGFVTGTPMYMSPEALTQPEKIDQRADLYAVGAVGFYLLTGTPVFQGDSMMDIATKHMKDAPERPSERLGEAVPADLEELILACLAKNPLERPSTARDLADRLSACQASGTWTRQQAREWWQGHSGLVDTEERHEHVVHDDGAATLVVDVEKRVEHDGMSAGTSEKPD